MRRAPGELECQGRFRTLPIPYQEAADAFQPPRSTVREPSMARLRARTASFRRVMCTAATNVGWPTLRSVTSRW